MSESTPRDPPKPSHSGKLSSSWHQRSAVLRQLRCERDRVLTLEATVDGLRDAAKQIAGKFDVARLERDRAVERLARLIDLVTADSGANATKKER